MQYYLYNSLFGTQTQTQAGTPRKKTFIGYTERNLTGGKNSVLLKTQQPKALQGGGPH